ncbi:MAG: hypothetical protein PVJ38_08325 [Candidatus Bathyarchaeota archaeon]|jgi:hypothetical protein
MRDVKIDFKKTVDVDWTEEKENWNEYKLEDGTTLKVKLVLRGVRRATDQYGPDGAPLYVVNSQNVVRSVNVPEELMGEPANKKQLGRV